MRAPSSFTSTAALATAAATVLGCSEVTPVANGPELHRATEIGFLPTEGPPLTQPREIHFEADRPDVTLLRLDAAGWSGHRALVGRDIVNETAYRLVPVCVAPCDATVTPAWYAVGGNDIARTLAFEMHDDATTVRVRAGGSQTLRELGMGSALGGAFLGILGGLGVLAYSDPHADPTGRTVAIDMLAIGVGALAVGTTLWLLNPPTKVAFEQ
jgi:hypothetical protein